MKVVRHRQFKKNFKSRISSNSKLVVKFEKRLELFLIDRKNPVLKDHKLIGKKKGRRAFSVTGGIRVIYKIERRSVKFYDIGTHNQVY